jgi:hypothetical protein
MSTSGFIAEQETLKQSLIEELTDEHFPIDIVTSAVEWGMYWYLEYHQKLSERFSPANRPSKKQAVEILLECLSSSGRRVTMKRFPGSGMPDLRVAYLAKEVFLYCSGPAYEQMKDLLDNRNSYLVGV